MFRCIFRQQNQDFALDGDQDRALQRVLLGFDGGAASILAFTCRRTAVLNGFGCICNGGLYAADRNDDSGGDLRCGLRSSAIVLP